jgi:hypothetical protein
VRGRAIAGFLVKLVPLLVLFLGPYPIIEPVFRPAYLLATEICLGTPDTFGKGSTLRFEKVPPEHAQNVSGRDVVLRLGNRTTGRQKEILLKSRHAWQPLGFYFALVLATGTSLRRRGWALVLGALALFLFTMIKLTVLVLVAFSARGLGTLELAPWIRQGLVLVEDILIGATTPTLIFPLLLWGLLLFCRSDLAVLRRGENQHQPPSDRGDESSSSLQSSSASDSLHSSASSSTDQAGSPSGGGRDQTG